MSRKTKRSIENEVKDLKTNEGSNTDPLICVLTLCDEDESPHPELTVQPHPEQKPRSYKVAVPKLLTDEYRKRRWLTVTTCENGEKFGLDESGKAVTACELWNALSDDDLEREKEIRQENNEPIPPLLEDL